MNHIYYYGFETNLQLFAEIDGRRASIQLETIHYSKYTKCKLVWTGQTNIIAYVSKDRWRCGVRICRYQDKDSEMRGGSPMALRVCTYIHLTLKEAYGRSTLSLA